MSGEDLWQDGLTSGIPNGISVTTTRGVQGGPPVTRRISKQYGTEGFREGLNWVITVPDNFHYFQQFVEIPENS